MKDIHATHKMGEWQHTIVTIGCTSRFGKIRICEYCEHEQAETVSGKAIHEELTQPCYGVE